MKILTLKTGSLCFSDGEYAIHCHISIFFLRISTVFNLDIKKEIIHHDIHYENANITSNIEPDVKAYFLTHFQAATKLMSLINVFFLISVSPNLSV